MTDRIPWECPKCKKSYAVPHTRGLTICPSCKKALEESRSPSNFGNSIKPQETEDPSTTAISPTTPVGAEEKYPFLRRHLELLESKAKLGLKIAWILWIALSFLLALAVLVEVSARGFASLGADLILIPLLVPIGWVAILVPAYAFYFMTMVLIDCAKVIIDIEKNTRAGSH